ncbi:unnamed protein product [Moneuplotes crassus]|uniref:Uncharacterized protein n=1 Tax=Euplotes crassus TaxID=5936 RepID=A0AAD1UIL8_EUPCR|nr:unnamed protein product [Moneuplotes crassus]
MLFDPPHIDDFAALDCDYLDININANICNLADEKEEPLPCDDKIPNIESFDNSICLEEDILSEEQLFFSKSKEKRSTAESGDVEHDSSNTLQKESEPLSPMSSTSDTNTSEKKRSPTAKKGQFSANLMRKDSLLKKGLRGSNQVIKEYICRQLKTEKPSFRRKLKDNSQIFKQWLDTLLHENFEEDLLNYDVQLNTANKRVLFSIISHILKGKRFYKKFIFDGIQQKEKFQIIKHAEDYFRFNDKDKGCGASRDYSLRSPAIALSKVLLLKDEPSVEAFWTKILGRKGVSIPDVNSFKKGIASVMDINNLL